MDDAKDIFSHGLSIWGDGYTYDDDSDDNDDDEPVTTDEK